MSYRQSTNLLYSAVREVLKTNKAKELYFLLCASCICHVFNHFMENPETKDTVFSVYLSQEKNKEPIFSYERFMHYLKNSRK